MKGTGVRAIVRTETMRDSLEGSVTDHLDINLVVPTAIGELTALSRKRN